MNYPGMATVERVRAAYPKGCRVVLDEMDDPYCNMPKGLQGTVAGVDDGATVHCIWDNGSSLGFAYGEDSFHCVASESEIRTSLEHLEKGENKARACPRCGAKESQENRLLALSRRADITVCEQCGMVEALEDAGMLEHMPLKEWAVVRAGWKL